MVVLTFIAIEPPLTAACRSQVHHRGNCFELYGLDVLVDSELRPWLLEVNLSPSLGCDTPLDVAIKARLLADTLTLVGVPAVGVTDMREWCSKQRAMRVGAKHAAQQPGTTTSEDEDEAVIRESLAEMARAANFNCIFPAEHSYARFFTEPRPINEAVRKRLFGERARSCEGPSSPVR